ncbi:hypothetical protein AB0N62_40720 [Streptomyces sp. NPDC093982]|uniref:hypothetical protein n=1 Tax=Streptomyces sp. NPDC093982 TaxID=3155077 RepID=UPI00342783D7
MPHRHSLFSSLPTHLPSAAALAVVLAVAPAPPAAAHGDTIDFAIVTTQPTDGRVLTIATWENDKDRVTESIAGTLSAVDVNGRSLGPYKLIPAQGAKATYTTRQVLPPGRWKVTVDCGFPDLGHGVGTVNVPAPGVEANSAPTSTSEVPPKSRRATRSAHKSPTSSSAPLWAGLAAVALGGGVAFLVWRHRMGRRSQDGGVEL